MNPIKSLFLSDRYKTLAENKERLRNIDKLSVLFKAEVAEFHPSSMSKAEKCFIVVTCQKIYYILQAPVEKLNLVAFTSYKQIDLCWCFSRAVSNQQKQKTVKYHFIEFKKGKDSLVLGLTDMSEYMMFIDLMRLLTLQQDFVQQYVIKSMLFESTNIKRYKVKNNLTNKLGFCKRYTKSELTSQEIKKIMNNVTMHKKLSRNKNVVGLQEVHETGGSIYIITDFIEGENVFVKNKLYEDFEMNYIVKKMLSVMKKLKKANIVLRNVRPYHFMYLSSLTDNNTQEIVITNLNFACFKYSHSLSLNEMPHKHYIAPEMLSNRRVAFYHPNSDIYTIGLLFFEMATQLNIEAILIQNFHEDLINNRNLFIFCQDVLIEAIPRKLISS